MENGGESRRGNGAEIAALGEEETEKAVGILIAAALPRLVRLGKEDGCIKLSFEGTELGELRAIVQGKAENGQTTESGKDGMRGIFGRSVRNRIPANETRPAIDQGNGSAHAASPDDGIAFPITDAFAELNFIRPIRNDAIRMNGVEISISVDFALAAATKVNLPINAGKQAAPDMPVDGRSADGAVRMFQRPAASNGSRRPEGTQTVNDKRFQLRV